MDLSQFAKQHWYVLKDSLNWEWDRYGDWNVSVTTILQLLEDPSFEFVKRNNAEALRKACDRWKSIHSSAESFFNWDSILLDKRILKWHVLYWVEVVRQETRYFKDWVSWTVDLEWFVNWTLRNVDYKSSNNQSMKYHLQLAGYYWLNWNQWSIVYLSKDSFEYVEVDVQKYLPVFLELKELFFTLKNRSWRPYSTNAENT